MVQAATNVRAMPTVVPLSKHRTPLSADPLNKVVPSSNKYNYIKSSVDCGLNVNKVQTKADAAALHSRFKRDELFKRIKASTLAEVVARRCIVYLLIFAFMAPIRLCPLHSFRTFQPSSISQFLLLSLESFRFLSGSGECKRPLSHSRCS